MVQMVETTNFKNKYLKYKLKLEKLNAKQKAGNDSSNFQSIYLFRITIT